MFFLAQCLKNGLCSDIKKLEIDSPSCRGSSWNHQRLRMPCPAISGRWLLPSGPQYDYWGSSHAYNLGISGKDHDSFPRPHPLVLPIFQRAWKGGFFNWAYCPASWYYGKGWEYICGSQSVLLVICPLNFMHIWVLMPPYAWKIFISILMTGHYAEKFHVIFTS